MIRLPIFKLIIFTLIIAMNVTSASLANSNLVLGTVEYGQLLPMDIKTEVRLDTGAKTSSLHAENITIFKKDHQKWVRFDLKAEGKAYKLEYRLVRYAKIKHRNAESSSETYEKRPVVLMELCLGKHIKEIEVNLTNRSNFTYPMLLGREAMKKFNIHIDPQAKYTLEPLCQKKQRANY